MYSAASSTRSIQYASCLVHFPVSADHVEPTAVAGGLHVRQQVDDDEARTVAQRLPHGGRGSWVGHGLNQRVAVHPSARTLRTSPVQPAA
ncbi:hypothetical protein BG452_18305 [Streptomyces sp. CBMA123]|nr:hypothetical protein [Streptomyces sp. CBMA123]